MERENRPSFSFFVVFEPSYSLGCLATLSSLARLASREVRVDVLMREKYRSAAEPLLDRVKRAHGDKIQIRIVIVPPEILAQCDAVRFQAHFIAEILFRLFYFEIVHTHSDFVVYLDIDMMLLGDAFELEKELETSALLHVVECQMMESTRAVTPAHMSRYVNSGFMVFDARDRPAIEGKMREAQQAAREVAAKASLYVDQDAINIAFYDDRRCLPDKWNFTLQQFTGMPLPADVIVLHATGSRKPWFFRGKHPFTPWYEKEADFLGLNFWQRYDFWWTFRRVAKKLENRFGG
jgi:lipopolysaccharide biosynthesis glycosyltransferase